MVRAFYLQESAAHEIKEYLEILPRKQAPIR